MKKNIQFLLPFTVLFLSSMLAYSQQMQGKCGEGCACAPKEDNSPCACGANSSCSMSHATNQVAHENVFLKMMDSMMVDMNAVPLDASVEGNFLRQMIPHHRGAVEMAKYEMDNGTNREMIQLAKNIFTEQQGEITKMNALLELYPFKQGEQPSPEYKKAMDDVMMKMMKDTPSEKDLEGKSIDCAFAMVMLPHHQAAVGMAKVLLKLSPQGQVATYAAGIVSDQQKEIQQMTEFVKQNCK